MNTARAYPNAEAVLINAKLEGISPVGWGAMGGDTANMHYWEFNSTNLSDGTPIDVTQRKPESRQLTIEKDAETIANYRNPAYVLGWTPAMAPMILGTPEAVMNETGRSMTLSVKVAAIPDASYQWLDNGVAIQGASMSTLMIPNATRNDATRYTVRVSNASGSATSDRAGLVSK
jgi:hypothetical protein